MRGLAAAAQVRPAASGGQQHPVPAPAPGRVPWGCAHAIWCGTGRHGFHPLVLLEMDPSRFVGTVYRAAGWTEVGMTRGFRRARGGYHAGSTPKKVLVRPLTRHARRVLRHPTLAPRYRHGRPRTMLSADQMKSLPDVFRTLTDPRSRYGRRYRLDTLLALAAAATLCGARGYKAIPSGSATTAGMLRHAAAVSTALRATEPLLSAQRREGGARGARCRAAGLVLSPRSQRRVAGRRQDPEGSRRRGGPSGPYPRGPAMRRPSPGVKKNRPDR